MFHRFIRQFFLPKEIQLDYWRQSVCSNARIAVLISILCIVIQLFNLYNLFFLSESKLGTVNNQIYFGFYCSMLLFCTLYLVLNRLCSHNLRRLNAIQCAGFSLWLIWCSALNYYDLVQAGHSLSTVIFVTALFGTAVCIQVVPWYAWLNYLVIGTLFISQVFPILGLGESWNLFVGVAMVLSISYARFSYTVRDIQNHRLIGDIHRELLEKTETLNLNLQKYNYVLKQTNNIILDWDLETDTAVFSGNWNNLFGLPAEIPRFSHWHPPASFLSAPVLADLTRRLKEAAEAGGELETEAVLTDPQGQKRWYSFRFKFQTDSHGIQKSCLGYLEDISKHKEEIFRLESTAKTDLLTGLLNRQGLYEYFQGCLIRKDGGSRLAMCLLDIDSFKEINDRYGHPCGDQALIRLAQALRKHFRSCDGIGRIGGDEFMVIFSFPDRAEILSAKAEELLKHAPQLTWDGQPLSLRFSIGLAFWDEDTFESLYKKADIALYSVKYRNKGSYQIYEEELGPMPD